MEKEIWKVYKLVPKYEVSNFGNVRHLKTKRIRKGCNNGNGYLQIGYKENGKNHNFYIHRAVAETFIDNTNDCDIVNHKDFNKNNNSVDNLEWCSQLYNVQHARNDGRFADNTKYVHLHESIITLLKWTNLKQQEIANMFNVSQWLVSQLNLKHVRRGRTC